MAGQKLSEHLHWFSDTCSVYLVRQGKQGLLIDCGTDLDPAALDGTGVQQVDRLLLTHFHRDQCSGALGWQQHGAQVTIPFAERRFLEESDLLRAGYDIYDNYTSYYPTFGPLSDVRSADYARDYERVGWQDLTFEVVPLPGHTFGSVGYLFQLDGRRILACGDLMTAPGRLWDYYPVQWRYMDFQGHANLLESLKAAAGLGVDLILPGHGVPFAPVDEAIVSLQARLERLYQLFHARPYEYYRPRFRQLSPHVFEVSNSTANTYIVADGAGHGLFIDCGYTATAPISANPHRYIDHLTPFLASDLGITQVEWFLPSHYHDDHLAGFPALRARYGTRMASSPEVRDIIEHPERFDMPCLVPEGVQVDAVISRNEPFHWRGFDFHMAQHPGQTLYHHLIWFEADGRRYLSIGDNISGLCFREQREFIHSFIPKNRTPVSSYRDMPRQILDIAPDVLLTGHGGAVPCEDSQVERWQAWMDEWQAIFTEIIDRPHPNLGMDPRWIEFYPYQVRIRPGAMVTYQLRVTNHEAETRECRVQFRTAPGVRCQPAEATVSVEPQGHGEISVLVEYPGRFVTHSLPVLADVTWGGRRLGEVAEAIAYF